MWILIGIFLISAVIALIFHHKKVKNYENKNEELVESNGLARQKREAVKVSALNFDEEHDREFVQKRKGRLFDSEDVDTGSFDAQPIDPKNPGLRNQFSAMTFMHDIETDDAVTADPEGGADDADLLFAEENLLNGPAWPRVCDVHGVILEENGEPKDCEFCQSLRESGELNALPDNASPVISATTEKVDGQNTMGNEMSNDYTRLPVTPLSEVSTASEGNTGEAVENSKPDNLSEADEQKPQDSALPAAAGADEIKAVSGETWLPAAEPEIPPVVTSEVKALPVQHPGSPSQVHLPAMSLDEGEVTLGSETNAPQPVKDEEAPKEEKIRDDLIADNAELSLLDNEDSLSETKRVKKRAVDGNSTTNEASVRGQNVAKRTKALKLEGKRR